MRRRRHRARSARRAVIDSYLLIGDAATGSPARFSTAKLTLVRWDTTDDSKPMMRTDSRPSIPALPRARSGSSRRRFAGQSFACAMRRVASYPDSQLGKVTPGGGAERRPILDAHPRLGDDPERPFAAEHHAVRAWAGAAPRQPPRLPPPARSEHARRLNEVIDVGVIGGVVAAGARRDPAAERGAREALREVTQRVAMRPKLVFQVRAEHAGLDARSTRNTIDLQHLVEPIHVDRNHRSAVLRAASRLPQPRSRRRTGSCSGRCPSTIRAPRRVPLQYAGGRQRRADSGIRRTPRTNCGRSRKSGRRVPSCPESRTQREQRDGSIRGFRKLSSDASGMRGASKFAFDALSEDGGVFDALFVRWLVSF